MSSSDTRRDTLLEYCFAPRGDSFQRLRETPGGPESPITTATASSAIKGTPPAPPIHRPERHKEPPKKVTFLDSINEVPRPEPRRFGQREYDGGNVLERKQGLAPQKKSGRNTLSLDHNVEPEEVLEHHCEPYFNLSIGHNTNALVWRPKAYAEDKYRSGVLTWETSDSDRVSTIKGVSHDNILKFIGVYGPSDGFNVAFEFLPVSLKEVAMSHMLEGEQMAAIMKQVLNGLEYLEQERVGLLDLSCSDVLMGFSGQVKIWGRNYCRHCDGGILVSGLHRITKELMTGHDRGDFDKLIDWGYWSGYHMATNFYEFVASQDRSGTSQIQKVMASQHTIDFLATAIETHTLGLLTVLVLCSFNMAPKYPAVLES